jgi:hypothetical protein
MNMAMNIHCPYNCGNSSSRKSYTIASNARFVVNIELVQNVERVKHMEA